MILHKKFISSSCLMALSLLVSCGLFLSPSSCFISAFSFRPSFVVGSKKSLLVSRATTSIVVPQPTTVDLIPGILAVDSMNSDLEQLLADLREEPFFRLYSVDMLGSCEYMPQQLFECYSASCEIYAVEEEDIVPQYIRDTDAEEHEFDLDGWTRWDMPTEDYYDTSAFPESYTGYDGSTVWRFIHDRICFNVDETRASIAVDSWQEDFNKAVSGLHSMISAQVIRGIDEKIRTGQPIDGEWTDPVAEFQRRLSPTGENKLALENLYFGYMLLLSAVSVARERLLRDCEAGKIDAIAAEKLEEVLNCPLLLEGNTSIGAARRRTRDLFRIMNCVQCNKCRLHGKISALGLSTAFQVLLGRSGDGGDPTRVHRVELAALMTTLSKFSTSIKFCSEMIQKKVK
mmetsp:Transcript_2642/g.4019  ORF Transcript_2642/g.4019 Transcript_2642/m.4019 type:complete len:401 (+) Transcript_2642:202-1404(+)